MYQASNRSPPQARASSGPWFASFPQLEPASDYCTPEWPPQMLQISDHDIERIVFLQRSNRSTHDPTEVRQNERTEYLGEGVLTALVSDFLYNTFTDYSERDLLAMREALLDTRVLAELCMRIYLHLRLRASPTERQPDDHTLAVMFGAYIGGLYNDRGSEGYASLREWFCFLITPYAMQCQSNYRLYKRSQRSQASADPFSSSSGHHGRMPSFSGGYPLDDPAMIARPGTAAPSIGRYATAGASSESTRNRGSYIQDLKEYCEKRRLSGPSFQHENNGLSGDHIQWTSTVSINGQVFGAAPTWSNTKKEADAKASRVALTNLQRMQM